MAKMHCLQEELATTPPVQDVQGLYVTLVVT